MSPKKKPRSQTTVPTSFRLDKKLLARLAKLAEKLKRKQTSLVEEALEDIVKKYS